MLILSHSKLHFVELANNNKFKLKEWQRDESIIEYTHLNRITNAQVRLFATKICFAIKSLTQKMI